MMREYLRGGVASFGSGTTTSSRLRDVLPLQGLRLRTGSGFDRCGGLAGGQLLGSSRL